MRIVHTIDGLARDSGGPSRTVTSLAGHLSEVGGPVDLIALGAADEQSVRPPCGDVRLSIIERPGGVDRFRVSRLRRELSTILDTSASTVVHDHGIWLPFNHAVAEVCRRVPAVMRVVSPRGMLEPWALGNGAWKKRIAWFSYQARDLVSARAFHATSEAEAAAIRSLGFVQPIAVIPNAVTTPRALPVRRQVFGGRRQVLFLSRIHPVKGLLNLVTAWGLLRPDDWCLSIVGGGEPGHRQEVEELIRELGLQSSISVAPQVDDESKWSLYADADLFVLPSHSENFGVVVAEAMLMGVPVITTTATPWSVIAEENCGWYVDTGVAALRLALEEAFRTPSGELMAMGLRGKRVVEMKYDWARIAAQMLEFYRWLEQGGSRPDWVRHDSTP